MQPTLRESFPDRAEPYRLKVPLHRFARKDRVYDPLIHARETHNDHQEELALIALSSRDGTTQVCGHVMPEGILSVVPQELPMRTPGPYVAPDKEQLNYQLTWTWLALLYQTLNYQHDHPELDRYIQPYALPSLPADNSEGLWGLFPCMYPYCNESKDIEYFKYAYPKPFSRVEGEALVPPGYCCHGCLCKALSIERAKRSKRHYPSFCGNLQIRSTHLSHVRFRKFIYLALERRMRGVENM